MNSKSEKVIEHMKRDLNGIKTGRAKPSLIEEVRIEAYEGSPMMLRELASISAPDPHMLIVQPWDHSILSKIEKGLASSDLNMNPIVDGQMIRIQVPPLTEERRRDLVKLVHQKLEGGKGMLRGIRNDIKKMIDDKKDEGGVSEDDVKQWQEEMQKIYNDYVAQLDELGALKEKELMEV